MKRNLYDLVGVPPEAPREMIASACRRRIAKLEAAPGEASRAEVYAVREAWSILGDDKLRAGYDASIATAVESPPASAGAAAMLAEIDPRSISHELFRPRRLAENWERYRKIVIALVVVGFIAMSSVWNESRRAATAKRIEAATYEAEYGEPLPGTAKAAKVEEAKPAEPFSAEKFERELKEREAAIQEQVASEQTAKEDEFRQKMQQENDPYAGRRRRR